MKLHWDGLIPILGGIYGLLVASGVVRVSRNAEANELWRKKFGGLMKILCPIVILFGLAILFGAFA